MALVPAFKAEKNLSGASLRFAIGLFIIALIGLSLPLKAQAKGNPLYASVVMDAETGMILHQRYADRKLHPASLAKMMTLLMAFEAIDNGTLSLRDRVVISRHANSMIPSKLDLPVGSSIRVEDAIYALVTKSANDVAVALAEKISGSESAFALEMTRKAREIGMNQTVFRNASGLHDPRQITTARDMARLAQYILYQHPNEYHYFSTQYFTYRGKTYRNHNRLMESYSGMDGFKTGYIGASGFNLVASAKRNNRRIIGVVFGGRTASSRNAHMKKLLDDGFENIDNIIMARAVPVPQRKPERQTQLASLQPSSGVAEDDIEDMSQWAELNPMLQSKAFREMIGEGDYDPVETRRLETGLMAIAAVKGVYDEQPAQSPSFARQRMGDWAIQVGAFQSRVKTEKVIQTAQKSLPATLGGASPIIVPLKTRKGWIFRGRLNGFTKEEALEACAHLKECLPVSPQAH